MVSYLFLRWIKPTPKCEEFLFYTELARPSPPLEPFVIYENKLLLNTKFTTNEDLKQMWCVVNAVIVISGTMCTLSSKYMLFSFSNFLGFFRFLFFIFVWVSYMCVFAVLPLFVICDTLQITNLDSYLYPLSPPYNFYYISPDHDRVFVIATLMSFLKDICKSAIHLVTNLPLPLTDHTSSILH